MKLGKVHRYPDTIEYIAAVQKEFGKDSARGNHFIRWHGRQSVLSNAARLVGWPTYAEVNRLIDEA